MNVWMENFYLVVASTVTLTMIEVFGMAMLRMWAKKESILALGVGVASFAGIAILLAYLIRIVGNVNVINAFWQASSIAIVSIISILWFEEPITNRELWGVVFAFTSSLFFIR